MVPCIIVQFYRNDQQDATVWDNLLFPCFLTALHVLSDTIAHQEHLSYSFWFIYVCCQLQLTTHLNKPEAVTTV